MNSADCHGFAQQLQAPGESGGGTTLILRGTISKFCSLQIRGSDPGRVASSNVACRMFPTVVYMHQLVHNCNVQFIARSRMSLTFLWGLAKRGRT